MAVHSVRELVSILMVAVVPVPRIHVCRFAWARRVLMIIYCHGLDAHHGSIASMTQFIRT